VLTIPKGDGFEQRRIPSANCDYRDYYANARDALLGRTAPAVTPQYALDVMDGHFVPNITIGPLVVASLRKALPEAILDCHLMIENPDEFIPAFAAAGASWISVHQEAG